MLLQFLGDFLCTYMGLEQGTVMARKYDKRMRLLFDRFKKLKFFLQTHFPECAVLTALSKNLLPFLFLGHQPKYYNKIIQVCFIK